MIVYVLAVITSLCIQLSINIKIQSHMQYWIILCS